MQDALQLAGIAVIGLIASAAGVLSGTLLWFGIQLGSGLMSALSLTALIAALSAVCITGQLLWQWLEEHRPCAPR